MKAFLILILLGIGFNQCVMSIPSQTMDSIRVYVGTYTRGESEGIYVADLDLVTGNLAGLRLAVEAENPSFLAIHPTKDFLYAVNELSEWNGQSTGSVSAFAIDNETGTLSLLSRQSSHGTGPCYLTADRSGSNVLVANYGSGSVAVLPIQSDGRLGEATAAIQHYGSGPDPTRQEGPHAHSINVDPSNKFAVAADLGLDKLLVYDFDPTRGLLTEHSPAYASVAGGAGPRHLSFHPNGRFAYVVNEMFLTVTAFAFDSENGVLSELQTVSTIPGEIGRGYSGAEIIVHPSGKFLYSSNRGHNSIAVFAVDQETGMLEVVEYEPTQGRRPRGFGIDPTGRYLLAANQQSDTIVVFKINQTTGALSAVGKPVDVPTPVSVKFVR